MSNQTKKYFIGGRELINIGIFTAIIFIITMAVMPLGFIPVLMPLHCMAFFMIIWFISASYPQSLFMLRGRSTRGFPRN